MRKLTIGICLSFSALMNAGYASTQNHHPHNLFVKLKKGQKMISSPLIQRSRKVIGRLYLVKTKDAGALEKELESHLGIEYVQKDFFGVKRLMPKLEKLEKPSKRQLPLDLTAFNDPDISRLWAFGASGMDVHSAYETLPPYAPEEVVVAVVDTGVDNLHEDLKDIMWKNPGEIPGDGVDNDGNGYVDDIHGINTLVRDSQGRATNDTMASHWHGTHVAGTIAATQNNGIGIAGVASNAKIMAIRTVPDDADELDSDIAEAFVYAAKNGAKIINCSFGKNVNEGGMVVRDVINEIALQHGVLVIAAAGNDYGNNNDVSLKFPASFDSESLLVVAATSNSGSLAGFTNVGAKTVDVAAPGAGIFSTINGNQYANASGTSMAAPNTSGVAAMVKGYFPDLSPQELKQVIMETVVSVPSYSGRMVTGGRVNLKAALEKAAEL